MFYSPSFTFPKTGLKPEKLVFLDETSAKTNMTRLYGRAPQGERVVDHTPHAHWINTTLVCGLRQHGIVAPHVFTGAMNKERFVDYLKRHLLPTLSNQNVRLTLRDFFVQYFQFIHKRTLPL